MSTSTSTRRRTEQLEVIGMIQYMLQQVFTIVTAAYLIIIVVIFVNYENSTRASSVVVDGFHITSSRRINHYNNKEINNNNKVLQKQQQNNNVIYWTVNTRDERSRRRNCKVSIPTKLYLDSLSDSENLVSTLQLNQNVKYLGCGPEAIIRPGVVMLAPKNEYHHFYRNAAIFIFAMGTESDNDNDEEYIIRGVILDHPTPFTVAEMIDEQQIAIPISGNPIGQNLLFRGGESGTAGIILLHNQPNNTISTQQCSDEIGSSGIYQGGWNDAIAACATGMAMPDNFKVFFNYCEFTETHLESLLQSSGESNPNDQWCSVEVDPQVVLNNDWDRGECWAFLRNTIRPYRSQIDDN